MDQKKLCIWTLFTHLKIQLTVIINFISSKDDNDEECEVLSKNDNIELTMSNEADEVLEKPLESLKKYISK